MSRGESSRRRRGAILLEVMLSIGLFVGAATFCMAVTRSLYTSIERADRRRQAVDLARSKMAELDAGLISIQELRGEWSGSVGSHPADDWETGAAAPRFEIDATTIPTEFPGLSLIELTVTEADPGAGPEAIAFTLRQLVALRRQDSESYEPGDLLRGLPAPEPGEPAGPGPTREGGP